MAPNKKHRSINHWELFQIAAAIRSLPMGIIKLVPGLGYPVLYINTPSNMMQRKLAVESSMRKSEMRRVLAVQTSVCTVCVQGRQRVKVSTEAYNSAFGFNYGSAT